MKEKIKKSLNRYHEENELFVQNKEEIEQLNYQFLKGLLFGTIVMCLVSITVFLLGEKESGGYGSVIVSYGITVLVLIIVYVAYKFVPAKYSLACFYMFFVALLAYSAYSAAILYPEYTGVISLGVFVLMPILILDKSERNIFAQLATLLLYLSFVIPFKEYVIHQDEIVYNISFAILGLVLGLYLRRVRLDNLELVRRGKIRETTDVLTGLFNRRKLFDYFGECETGKNKKPIYGISILDIDHFKEYNDTYGHLAGDACLKAVGKCMQTYGKQHDMEFYRYGGEEFVAIAHEPDPQKMAQNFTNIGNAIESLHIERENGVVTISQGVYFLRNEKTDPAQSSPINVNVEKEGNHLNGLHFQQYLSQADKALYQAKDQGRNRTVFDR